MNEMMASSSESDAPYLTTTLHSDLFHSHILTRLDGPSLAAASASSSAFRRLSLHDPLWRHICTSTWPSLRHVIPSSHHRSLFLDSFPTVHHHHHHHPNTNLHPPSTQFISAVDIYYHDTPFFSKVHPTQTQTQTAWFNSSPLWIDLLDPKESVPTPIRHVSKDVDLVNHLEQNLRLSWILIDPSSKRAANLSSRRAVAAQRHWLTGDLEVVYAVVMEGPTSSEWAQCNIKVVCTCGEEEVHVREVSLTVEDADGRSMSGEKSMAILQSVVESGTRKRLNHEESKARFDEFLALKKQRREIRERNDQALDLVLIFFVIAVFLFFSRFFFF